MSAWDPCGCGNCDWVFAIMYVAEPCSCASCADDRGWGLCLRWAPRVQLGGETQRKILVARWLNYSSLHGFYESDTKELQAEFPDAWLLPGRTASPEEMFELIAEEKTV